MAVEVLGHRVPSQRRGREVEQPGRDHASAPPYFGDIGKVDVEALSFRQLVRRPALEHVEPFSIGLHQTVFDAVVDHLDEMARAGRTDVDVALLGTRILNFLARGGARACAQPRRERIERSEENTSELQSLMRISYADFCL